MKRRLIRLFGCLLGVTLLLAALLAWDILRRAKNAVEADERGIADEIARLRFLDAPRQSPLQDWPDYRDEVASLSTYHAGRHWPCYGIYGYLLPSCGAVRRGLEEASFPYGEAGSRSPEFRDWASTRRTRESIRGPVSSWDWALIAHGLLYDAFPGGGLERARLRLECEEAILKDMDQLLLRKPAPLEDLREICRVLDRLRELRPRLADAIAAESIRDRLRVIRVLRTHSDPDHFLRARPNWKSLFSWNVFLAQVLHELNRDAAELRALAGDPPVRPGLLDSDPERKGPEKTASVLSERALPLLTLDRRVGHRWDLLRETLAKEWFRAEQGRPPLTAGELVPKYAPRLTPLEEERLTKIAQGPK